MHILLALHSEIMYELRSFTDACLFGMQEHRIKLLETTMHCADLGTMCVYVCKYIHTDIYL